MDTTDSNRKYRVVRKDGQLNVKNQRDGKILDIRDLYHDLLRLSWPKFFGAFTGLFFFINCFFGAVYSLLPRSEFDGSRHADGLNRFLESFFFSVQTFGTIGYGKMSPVGLAANAAVTFECYIGILVTAVLTGLIFSRFARPHAKVIFSEKAVIRKYDGVPSLLFRMANARQNYISEARVDVSFAFDNPKTGFRDFCDLELERSRSPIFALSWTISHDINEDSPLHGLSMEDWARGNAEVVVTFSGVDTTLSQQVHAKTSYIAEEILFDYDFADVIKRSENGILELMLEKFHEVEKVDYSRDELPITKPHLCDS